MKQRICIAEILGKKDDHTNSSQHTKSTKAEIETEA